MSQLKKFNKHVSKRLVATQVSFQFLNCPSGCHKNHIALFDPDGEQLTPASDDPVKAVKDAVKYFSGLADFLAREQVGVSKAPKSEKSDTKTAKDELPAEISELADLLASVFGPGRVKITARHTSSEKAQAAEAEPNQTAG